MESITQNDRTSGFVKEIESISHANLSRCWHCLCCSGGCPFSRDMDILSLDIHSNAETVEKAFQLTKALSKILREKIQACIKKEEYHENH